MWSALITAGGWALFGGLVASGRGGLIASASSFRMGILAIWNRNPRRCRQTAPPMGVRATDQSDRQARVIHALDIVACHLPRENRLFPLQRDLPEQIADAEGHRPYKDRFAVLRDPDEMDLEIRLAVRPTPVAWHATILPLPGTRLKARVFHYP